MGTSSYVTTSWTMATNMAGIGAAVQMVVNHLTKITVKSAECHSYIRINECSGKMAIESDYQAKTNKVS